MPYEKSEALRGYLQRVGAVELSFKRFSVREYDRGYPVEKAIVLIKGGTIEVSSKNHDPKEWEPTAEERSAIEKGLVNADIPRSVGARSIDQFSGHLKAGADTFVVWDRRDDLIVMVQQLWRHETGAKSYPCWTLWSDGEVRKMEPDGRLPFWKPRKRTAAARLMIHEGAKAARYVQEDIVDRGGAGHPWAEDLRLYEHWGMLGGAMAPGRALYSEIDREKFLEVVYSCDNDHPGQAALQEVSKSYGKAMKGLRYDGAFPESWDLADPMPKELFAGTRWVGTGLKDHLVFATRATTKKKEKSPPRLTRQFREEWVHCVSPEVFIHRDWPSVMLTDKEFNNKTAPYSDVRDTASLLKTDDASKGAILKYSPAERPGLYATRDGGRFINTHVPSSIRPEEGDVTPWLEFMNHLVEGDGDRRHLMRWIATLVSRPDVKMLYGVLLVSETQGVGKGTLGEKILAPLVGKNNASFPSESEICDSNYNYWLAHKRLAVIHEIYAGHSAKAYNSLKNVITDKDISVSKKYMATYSIENWIHVFACSNSLRAIQLNDDDRRWLMPKVTELKRSPSYWTEFNRWITDDGGLNKIRWWCDRFVDDSTNVVRQGEEAPWTAVKGEAIEEGMSEVQKYVVDLMRKLCSTVVGTDATSEKIRQNWKSKGHMIDAETGVFTLDVEVRDLVRNKFYSGRYDEKLLKPLTLRKAARRGGAFVGDHKISDFEPWSRKMAGTSRILSTSKWVAERLPGEICFEGRVHRPLTSRDLEEF